MNRLLVVCTLLMVSAVCTRVYAEPKENTGAMKSCTCTCGSVYQRVDWPSGSSCSDIDHVPCTQSTPSGDEQHNLSNCTSAVEGEKPASKAITPGTVSPGGLQKPLNNPTAPTTPQGLQPKPRSN